MGNQIFPCVADENESSNKLLEKALAKDTQLNNDIRLARMNKRLNSSYISFGHINGSMVEDETTIRQPAGIKIESSTLKRSPKNKN